MRIAWSGRRKERMFRRIANVKDFGVFRNFSGGSVPEFSTFNIIYGWNYSGKTTLSRIFRCLEKGEIHADYSDARFTISHQDGTIYDEKFNARVKVQVFNEDFCKENLSWNDANGFNPILLLGAENIDIHADLELKEIQRAKINQERVMASQEGKNSKILSQRQRLNARLRLLTSCRLVGLTKRILGPSLRPGAALYRLRSTAKALSLKEPRSPLRKRIFCRTFHLIFILSKPIGASALPS